jgi:hypothetical protein
MTRGLNTGRARLAATALKAFAEASGGGDGRTVMLDLIADLGHLASRRGYDFPYTVAKAVSLWAEERKRPDSIDRCPQVTITIEGRRPKRAWPERPG